MRIFIAQSFLLSKTESRSISFVEGRLPATKVKILKSMMSFAEMAEEIIEEDVVNAAHN